MTILISQNELIIDINNNIMMEYASFSDWYRIGEVKYITLSIQNDVPLSGLQLAFQHFKLLFTHPDIKTVDIQTPMNGLQLQCLANAVRTQNIPINEFGINLEENFYFGILPDLIPILQCCRKAIIFAPNLEEWHLTPEIFDTLRVSHYLRSIEFVDSKLSIDTLRQWRTIGS